LNLHYQELRSSFTNAEQAQKQELSFFFHFFLFFDCIGNCILLSLSFGDKQDSFCYFQDTSMMNLAWFNIAEETVIKL